MARRTLFAGMMALAALGTGMARAAEPENIFPIFKTFCIDTQADGARIQAAVESAGGKKTGIIVGRGGESIDTGGHDWVLPGFGQPLTVVFRTILLPVPPSLPPRSSGTSCSISSAGDKAAIASAAAAWAAVPAKSTSVYMVLYEFRDDGAGHVYPSEVHDDAGWDKFFLAGNIWQLFVKRDGNNTRLELRHIDPASDTAQ
jgi:hypothetical protein